MLMSRPSMIQRQWVVDKEFQFSLIRQFILFCALITVVAVLAFTIAYHYYGTVDSVQTSSGPDAAGVEGEKVSAFDVFWPVFGGVPARFYLGHRYFRHFRFP